MPRLLQSLETSNRQNKKYNVANYARLRRQSWAVTRVLESVGKICMRIYLPGGSRNDAKDLCNNEKKAHSRLLGRGFIKVSHKSSWKLECLLPYAVVSSTL